MIDMLWRLANDLLTATVEVLEEGSRPVPAPGRRVVETGSVVNAPVAPKGVEDDRLAVNCFGPKWNSVGPLTSAPRDRARRTTAGIWSAKFAVSLHRTDRAARTPIPSKRNVQDTAYESMLDQWQIARGIAYRWQRGILLPSLSTAHPGIHEADDSATVELSDVTPISPQGGVYGCWYAVTCLLPGIYTPETAGHTASDSQT